MGFAGFTKLGLLVGELSTEESTGRPVFPHVDGGVLA